MSAVRVMFMIRNNSHLADHHRDPCNGDLQYRAIFFSWQDFSWRICETHEWVPLFNAIHFMFGSRVGFSGSAIEWIYFRLEEI